MSAFVYNAQKLNRQVDENVFQQLSSRYAEQLKAELKQAAEQLLEQHKETVNSDLLRLDFSNHISYSLTEFRLKIRSM